MTVLTLSGNGVFPPAIAHLAAHATWIGWKWGPVLIRDRATGVRVQKVKDGRPQWTKVPCSAGGANASFMDVGGLRTYAQLHDAVANKVIAGVGLAGVGNDGSWLVLDLDKCRDRETGEVAEWAVGIVEAAGSYCEVSPSGTGLRIVGGSAGWAKEERSRRWCVSEDSERGGYGGHGETFFSAMFATITFAAVAGYEDKWCDIGWLAASLPRRREDRETGGAERGAAGVSSGADPCAPIEIVAETLGMLPNGGRSSWNWWNHVGMCVFRASEGSDAGLEAWEAWSRTHPSHDDEDTCVTRWEHWRTSSPPTEVGFPSLLWMAREAQKAIGNTGWRGGEKWSAYWEEKTRSGAAGMGPIEGNGGTVPAGGAVAAGMDGPGVVVGAGKTAFMGNSAGPAAAVGAAAVAWQKPTIATSGVTLANLTRLGEAALFGSGFPLMQRGGRLVRPVTLEVDTFHKRRTSTTVFAEMRPMGLTRLLSDVAHWTKWSEIKKKQVFSDPPEKIAGIVLEDVGEWPFPTVHGLSSIPVVRRDGTVFAEAGYDSETGIYVMPDKSLDFAAIRAAIDRPLVLEDALAAMAELDALVDEFPFVGNEDRSVALSAMLTPVARSGMDVAPAHMINAPLAGTGKSFLATLCASLALGRAPYVFSAGKDEAEMDKRLHGALLAGNAVTVLDNVNGVLYGEFLSQMIEQRMLMLRPLGGSDIMNIVNMSCLLITGNNISATKDMLRKVLECTLDANMEKPETRTFAGDPLECMQAGRQRYLVAALVAIRAHAMAGFPCRSPRGGNAAEPLASFGDWSHLVRGLLIWTGRADPVKSMERTRIQDPDAADMRDFTRLWVKRFGLGEANGRTTQEIAESVTLGMGAVASGGKITTTYGTPEENNQFRDLIQRIAPGRTGGIDVHKLGHWLRRHMNHVSGNIKLVSSRDSHKNVATWNVVSNLKLVD
jgi:putative DNA primase/helicase